MSSRSLREGATKEVEASTNLYQAGRVSRRLAATLSRLVKIQCLIPTKGNNEQRRI